MSVSDPLLKELKGHAARLLEDSARDGLVTDSAASLQPFCETLETIFHRGLVETFPVKKPESWHWLLNIASPRFETAFSYCSAVENVKENSKVSSSRGYFRLLIRTCLVRNCLHVPVEKLVHMRPASRTYTSDSILGDEILGEILLSVLLQCSKLKFKLELENAAFLDETWQLGSYKKLELVPCKSIGICIGFVLGKGVVVRVEPSSVAAEDEKVGVGDVIDEINGHAVTAAMRGKLGGIMRQSAGKPILLNLVKATRGDGTLYPPLRTLHGKLNISVKHPETTSRCNPNSSLGSGHKAGFSVDFLGEVSTGKVGDVAQIARAVLKASGATRHPVQLELLEMGVRVTDRVTDKVISKHSYMEISSCGRHERQPNLFAYIAGECSCNQASQYTCYVFHSKHEEHIVNILHSIAQGFQRTHWAV